MTLNGFSPALYVNFTKLPTNYKHETDFTCNSDTDGNYFLDKLRYQHPTANNPLFFGFLYSKFTKVFPQPAETYPYLRLLHLTSQPDVLLTALCVPVIYGGGI